MPEEAPNYPTLTWHILEDGTQRTVCTGSYWEPPPSDKYPDTERELCVACQRDSLRRPTHADARSEQLTGDQLTIRPDLDEQLSDGEDGYLITARVREKGLRPAIVNGLYYWTDLDPHDDEAWIVDAIVKAARARLSDRHEEEGSDG